MKLITECQKCNKTIKINSIFADNRIELAQNKGKEFDKKCPHCGNTNNTKPLSRLLNNIWYSR